MTLITLMRTANLIQQDDLFKALNGISLHPWICFTIINFKSTKTKCPVEHEHQAVSSNRYSRLSLSQTPIPQTNAKAKPNFD